MESTFPQLGKIDSGMEDKEIYKKLLEAGQQSNKNTLYLDAFMLLCMVAFVGWSIAKDIAQETKSQKLNGVIIQQQIVIQQLDKSNRELEKALQQLLDATRPNKSKSEA